MRKVGKNKYTEKDAAEDTEVSVKEANRTWHKARDDAAEEGGWGVPKNRHDSKNSGNNSKK